MLRTNTVKIGPFHDEDIVPYYVKALFNAESHWNTKYETPLELIYHFIDHPSWFNVMRLRGIPLSKLPEKEIEWFERAMKTWEAVANIKFIPGTAEQAHLVIYNGEMPRIGAGVNT